MDLGYIRTFDRPVELEVNGDLAVMQVEMGHDIKSAMSLWLTPL